MTKDTARARATWRWRYLALALIIGAFGALAHPPFSFEPAILLTLTGGFVLLGLSANTREAWRLGWAMGIGYFGSTLTWIAEPFQIDAATTGWMAPLAAILLAALLGAFWAATLAFARWAGGRSITLVVAWGAAEMLRAYLFTGFPWASPPQALVDSLAGQGLAWFGPHGLMLCCAGAAALIVAPRRAWPRGLTAAVAFGLILSPPLSDPSERSEITVRLVQPNAPQEEKWDPERSRVFVDRQIEYTAAGEIPDLVIWPETALPYLQENAQVVFDIIGEAARGAPVVLGIQRRENQKYFNSLVVLDETGGVTQTYDKHHLVPFGEYMPFEWFFRHINVGGLAARAEGGFAAGQGPQLLKLGNIGTALPLICYEAVFAHDVGGTMDRPRFLMQLTNDAWFGKRSGPQQHLAQARMRAIEQGLPLVRAANTGISAVIDPKGRIVSSLGLNTAGYLDAQLPEAEASTLYSITGDGPWAVLILIALIGTIVQRTRRRRATSIDANPSDA